VRSVFGRDEVVILAVAWEEGVQRALEYVGDTGIVEPVALDLNGVDANCWEIPEGESSLYRYFNDRVALSALDSPFPFQILLAPDGTLAYASRLHQPDVILARIGEMLP